MNNNLKTFVLLVALSLLLIAVGGMIGGRSGIMFGFLISLVMNGGAYFFSDKLALSSNGAQPLAKEQAPEIYNMVQDLSHRAKIPMPKLYTTPEMQANAFATGRDLEHSSIAVTQGLLQSLSNTEIKAVLAHEIGHIKNRDILIATIAAVIASTVGYLGNMAMFSGMSNNDEEDNGGGMLGGIAMMILAPLMGTIIQMAISRSREYAADATAKELIGSGQPLAQALRAIHATVQQSPAPHVNPAYASMYIANPFEGMGNNMAQLFSTHPPVEERIKRLLQ